MDPEKLREFLKKRCTFDRKQAGRCINPRGSRSPR
jgi:hypothetical protein